MQTARVKAFHEKHSYDRNLDIKEVGRATGTSELYSAAAIVEAIAKKLENGKTNPSSSEEYDSRLMRAHLILEEAAEVLLALAERDLVKLADGLGDLDYVTHGAAVAFGIPLDEIAEEIHRSNMTKAVRKGDVRLRNKGEDYQPPRIKEILDGCAHVVQ